MIVQVTRSHLRLGTAEAIAAATLAFGRDRCVLLPRFFAPSLCAWVQGRVAHAAFAPLVHDAIGTHARELVMRSPADEGRLYFLMNDPALFRFIRTVTGRGAIGSFSGRVYQMVPGQGHHDDWHDDLDGNRILALSVNLSAGMYAGGVLELIDADSRRPIHAVHNTGPGDAILFDLADSLLHRVTDVTGGVPKVALAGWFLREPVYANRLAALRREHVR
jgi:hypothetical protein